MGSMHRYLAGEDICTVAEDVNFPPCLLLRLVLDTLDLGLTKGAVKAVMAAPAALPSHVQVPQRPRVPPPPPPHRPFPFLHHRHHLEDCGNQWPLVGARLTAQG